VFLPGLIFKDAVDIPINLFLVAGVQIWILSFPMVLVGTALTGVAGKYCLPYDSEDPTSFGWWAWIILGAILASTDPIAVASVLKTAGASPRLVMHISGESLMNDGSSYVFFQIASQLWYDSVGLQVQNDIGTWGKSITYFFRMSFGGTLVGALFGFGLLGVLWELDRRMERDFDIIQVVFGLATAYLCYFVCDQIIGMSGVIATVACGIVVNRFGRGLIHDKELMSSYLALADFLLNTLLFALGGVIWAAISFSTQQSDAVTPRDWGYLMMFYFLCMIIRFIQVGVFYPILSRIGLKSNWKEGVFLAYGGLHGSVGVALGLALIQYVFQYTEDINIRNAATKLQFLGGGATLLTLTINGTTAGAILKMLGLVKPPVSAEYIKHVFEGTAKDFVYNEIAKLFQEERFQNVSFNVLMEHVPFVSKEPPKLHDGHNHETTIQKFHQRVVRDGAPYISLLNATERASKRYVSASTENEEYKTELLVEMRQIFLELLREAYKVEEEMGELCQLQHKGYLYDILMQSVDLAINEVRYDGKPIEDWQHTEQFSRWERITAGRSPAFKMSTESAADSLASPTGSNLIPQQTDLRASNASFTQSLMSIVSFESNEQHIKKKTQITMKRIRMDVLRALAFKHGHEMAEAKLQLYVNRFDDEDERMRARHLVTEETLETILSESRDQVRLAEEMLEKDISDKDLEIILSHYCAKILVRRLRKFTEEKSKEGMIGKQETRIYLRGMKEVIRQIDSKFVDRLAESRLSVARFQEHRRTRSDVMRSIIENGNGIAIIDNSKHSVSTTFHPLKVRVDQQNDDTFGRSNVHHRVPTTPLGELFHAPSEVSETTMPEIDDTAFPEIDENMKRNNKKMDFNDKTSQECDTC